MAPNIILYHYPYSPYARKVFWYLRLRSIPFQQCIQPPILPRPDLSSLLGITYRRIPLTAIDGDVYCDTSLILGELERRFPYNDGEVLDPLYGHGEVLAGLVEGWADEVFVYAGRLIPQDLPLLRDIKFQEDRRKFWPQTAARLSKEEALSNINRLFHTVETIFLSSGSKKWILGGDKPTVADLMAIWPLDWLNTLPGALPPQSPINLTTYPATFSWLQRFQSLYKSPLLQPPVKSIPTISGSEAKNQILTSPTSPASSVDTNDPLGIKEGEWVSVVPTDSGVLDPQVGRLRGLGVRSVVVEVEVPGDGKGNGNGVRVHFPRRNYRVTRVGEGGKKVESKI